MVRRWRSVGTGGLHVENSGVGLGVCVGVLIAVLGALSDDGPFPIAGSKFHEAKEAAKETKCKALNADTANSAYLSFTYHLVSDAGTLPFRMLGENTELRFRIDATGGVLGFQYVRTGMLPGTIGTAPITLTMNSR